MYQGPSVPIHNERRTLPMPPKDILLYLGYDLEIKEDLLRLSKNAGWVDENRAKEEKRAALRPPLIIGLILAAITGVITIGVTWFIHTSGL